MWLRIRDRDEAFPERHLPVWRGSGLPEVPAGDLLYDALNRHGAHIAGHRFEGNQSPAASLIGVCRNTQHTMFDGVL